MELGNNAEKQFQDESVWVPQTPAKSIPARLISEDILPDSTISSEILANQYHGLNQNDEKAVDEDIKVYIKTKHKGSKKRRYRPKVVREGKIKINRTPKTKTPNPSTPTPRTPNPPKRGISRKSLGKKSNIILDNILKASHEASQDVHLDLRQVLDPSPEVSPHISTDTICSTVFSENCDTSYVQENSRDLSDSAVEECADKNLVDLKPEVESKSCRQALSFSLLFDNDQRKRREDGNASCATSQRGGNNSRMLVYKRKRFKLERCNFSRARMLVYQRKRFRLERFDLRNCRKFGPDFPKILGKERTKRTTSFTTFLTSLLAVGRQSGNINNHLNSVIAEKDTNLNIVKRRRSGRKKHVLTTLTSYLGTDGVQNCEQPSSTKGKQSYEQPSGSLETSQRQMALIPVAQSSVVDGPKSILMDSISPLSIPRQRAINVSEPKLYSGFLNPRFGPPQKKLRVLEDLMKKFHRLHIDDIGKRPGPKKKGKSGVGQKPGDGQKPGELILYDSKKLVPKVVIDQETEREWNLLMQSFHGGADEERGEGREKWWEEERRIFRVRMLTFVAIMHIIQGDRRFSVWKGSVVDSVVGVFLTQNVSDHLSSSAFMTLASRFPIKPKNKPGYVNSCRTQNIPVVEEVKPERGDCFRNSHLLESEIVLTTGSRSVTMANDSERNQEKPVKPKNEFEYVNSCRTETIPVVEEVEPERGNCSRNTPLLKSESVLPTRSPSVTMASDSDKNQEKPVDWDELRRTYGGGAVRETSGRYLDSVDWEAVRRAPPALVSEAIKKRGQHVVIGGKIQAFLDRLVKDHGSIDLEWLRNVPPDKAKEYLLSFYGLGLKSVECIRLLCLHHHAFPVDINVARVAVRLGWVPLQPLPGGIEFHLLNEYPIMDAVQVYLWPRLCKLDQKTLYELHYQMITFGKVFCKKRKPSCGTCPMRGECRHHASEVASSRLSLPGTGTGTEKESTSSAIVSISAVDDSLTVNATTTESFPPSSHHNNNVQPLVEFPPSPVHISNKELDRDIEDWYGQIENEENNVDVNEEEDIPIIRLGTEECNMDEDDIPIIKLDTEELKKRFLEAMHQSDIVLPEKDVSKALIALTSGASSIPAPKLKNVGRLKTVHHVYELPDDHAILAEVQKREPDDPSPYLLVIWASDADAGHSKPFRSQSCSTRSEPHDDEMTCSLDNMKDQNSETVLGTLMIPCRTANKGRFPLNGTYFQVNEVFVDDESAEHPIQVPRKLLWNLRRRFLYCGSSASAIFTAISIEEIQHCFWRGFICVRAFDRRTRAPVDLPDKFHTLTGSKSGKEKSKRKHTHDL